MAERAYPTIKEPCGGYEYASWERSSESDVDAPDENEGLC